MKRFLLILLMLIMLLAACATKPVTTVDPQKYGTTDEVITAQSVITCDPLKYGTTDEVIASQREQFPPMMCFGAMKDSFALNCVVITVYPFANEYEYTPDDFSYLGCKKVTEMDVEIRDDKPSRKLILSIDAPYKQDVLDALEVLGFREDVYQAEPNGWIIVD